MTHEGGLGWLGRRFFVAVVMLVVPRAVLRRYTIIGIVVMYCRRSRMRTCRGLTCLVSVFTRACAGPPRHHL